MLYQKSNILNFVEKTAIVAQLNIIIYVFMNIVMFYVLYVTKDTLVTSLSEYAYFSLRRDKN